MVVEQASSFIKPAGVRRSDETQLLAVEMVAEFMAQSAQECAEGRNLLAHGGARPYADLRVSKRVISKKLDLPSALAYAKGSGGKRADFRRLHVVKGGCCIQEFGAGRSNLGARAFLHDGSDHLGQICELRAGGQFDAGKLFALAELTKRFAGSGRPICNHQAVETLKLRSTLGGARSV